MTHLTTKQQSLASKWRQLEIWEEKFNTVRSTIDDCRFATKEDKEYFANKAEKELEEFKNWLETHRLINFNNIPVGID